MFLYLAAPIDFVSDNGPIDRWRDSVRAWAADSGVNVFDPSRAFTVNSDRVTPQLQKINQAAIECCNFVVAFLPEGVITQGTIIEVALSANATKTVFLQTPKLGWSMAGFLGRPNFRHARTTESLLSDLSEYVGVTP